MENSNQETSQNNSKDFWQAEVLGQIYDTNFVEMTEWIGDGSLQATDKVRRGNLRWIEARKVPLLIPFFNAKEQGIEPPAIHTSVTNSSETPTENFTATENFVPDQTQQNQNSFQPEQSFQPNKNQQEAIDDSQINGQNLCVLHPEYEAKFHCETCANVFCGQCPKSYGGNVKICPMCGAMCKKIGEIDKKKEKDFHYGKAMSEGFGFSDIVKAFGHPFKFTASFLIGGVMFMLFTLGQSSGALGGAVMIFAALFCFMLANMLGFGILANTVENFSQGKIETNFMPNFEDFNLWDDVIHPFFLSIGAYLTSFGPFILVTIIGFYLMFSSMAQMQKAQAEAEQKENAQVKSPYLIDEKKAYDQSEEVKKLLEGVKQKANEKRDLTEKSLSEVENLARENDGFAQTQNNEKQAEQINQIIVENQKRQLESVAGKTEETKQEEYRQMVSGFMKLGLPLLILGFVALVWGIFYFPAACAVAGYTRSFFATINPSVGINTIKTFGADYLKIFGVFVLILIATSFISGFFAAVFSAFALPGMGNIPAAAISSWFTFYFTIVFSCVIGFALYKNSDKFKFYKG